MCTVRALWNVGLFEVACNLNRWCGIDIELNWFWLVLYIMDIEWEKLLLTFDISDGKNVVKFWKNFKFEQVHIFKSISIYKSVYTTKTRKCFLLKFSKYLHVYAHYSIDRSCI